MNSSVKQLVHFIQHLPDCQFCGDKVIFLELMPCMTFTLVYARGLQHNSFQSPGYTVDVVTRTHSTRL